MLPQVSRTESIRFRVSPEEKAELEQRAGSMSVSAFVREAALHNAAPSSPDSRSSQKGGCNAAADTEQGRAAPASSPMPAQSWRGRVNQLVRQGVPQRAAERVADQELR